MHWKVITQIVASHDAGSWFSHSKKINENNNISLRMPSLGAMDDSDVPDTRVFVSGLPPNFDSNQLGAHFAGRYQVTDARVIPERRIGFVGFRNYTLAKNAVKYFDKSYIRLSKISVQMAKPVRSSGPGHLSCH